MDIFEAVDNDGDVLELELELMVQRPIRGNWTAVGVTGFSTYGEEIKDSPIVDEDYSYELVLGIIYSF